MADNEKQGVAWGVSYFATLWDSAKDEVLRMGIKKGTILAQVHFPSYSLIKIEIRKRILGWISVKTVWFLFFVCPVSEVGSFCFLSVYLIQFAFMFILYQIDCLT